MQLISKEALRQYMQYRGYSIKQLADKIGCSKATIGHLHSLESPRNTVGPEIAKAIEKALDAPQGSLFMPRVSGVNGSKLQKPVAA